MKWKHNRNEQPTNVKHNHTTEMMGSCDIKLIMKLPSSLARICTSWQFIQQHK